jgi:hypothetical protein
MPGLRQDWAALVALGAVALATLAGVRWESGSSAQAEGPRQGQVAEASYAVGPDGRGVAIWTEGEGDDAPHRMLSASRSGGDFAAPRELVAGGRIFSPTVAVGPGGHAAVVYRSGETQGALSLFAARLDPDGGVAGPWPLGPADIGAEHVELGVAADGSYVVAWSEFGRSPGEAGDYESVIHAQRIGREGPSGAPFSVESAGGGAIVRLAVAPSGRAALVYGRRAAAAEAPQLELAEAAPGADFEAAAPVMSAGTAGADLAYDSEERLRLAWVEPDPADPRRGSALTSVREGGTFSEPLVLSREAAATTVQVVAIPGRELVAWQRARFGPDGVTSSGIASVVGDRVVGRDVLAARHDDVYGGNTAPIVTPSGGGALAYWATGGDIDYANCTADAACGDPVSVVSGGRRERVRLAGAGPRQIAWVEGSEDDGELRVADIGD